MAGSTLLNCPLEVISAICFRLCDHCNGGYNRTGGDDRHSLAALSNFSKTCKVVQHVAQPFLFHFVSDRSRSDFDQIALLRTIPSVEPEDFDDSETISVVETWQAMEQKKETLKEITMDVDWPWEVESGTLTTLQHFGRLEVLEAHSVAIEAIRTGWSRAHERQDKATGGNFLF